MNLHITKYFNSKYFAFLAVTTLWPTVFFGLPDFLDNPIEGFHTYLSIVAYLIVLYIVVLPVIMLATINKYISAVFLPLFGILGSIVAYYRAVFQATVTVVMIDAVFNTTAAEASSVLTIGLFAYIGLNILFSIGFVVWRFHIGNLSKPLIFAICGLFGLIIAYNGSERVRNSIVQRYPYNIYFYGKEYYDLILKRSHPREMLPAKEISQTPDSLTVILILGESIRADHMSFNGYHKDTTPLLEKDSNLVSMGDIWTPHTDTGSAIPYIMTPATKNKKEWAQEKESFIPYYKNKGFHTIWLSNQDMGNGYSYFINTADKAEFVNSKHSVWTFNTWTDKDLINPLKGYLHDEKKRELIIVHTIGAHWYYNLHYPQEFTKFSPVASSRVVTNNTQEEVINSYDNCVSYMDFFVHSIITMLANRNAILIYQSDHGEALGENGKWLHAYEEEVMHHPAGFIWYSDKYKDHYNDNVQYIKELSRKKNDADYVFPLMLRIIGLEIANY